MSIVALSLFLLAVLGSAGIMYGAYRLYRSGKIDDELVERERLAQEAARAEEIEKLYPGIAAKLNKDKVKKFSSRT